MQTAADIFRASMAKLFENPAEIDREDIYYTAFPEILKSCMMQCRRVENGRRVAYGLPPVPMEQCLARYPADSTAPVPFCDELAVIVFPLFIASEYMRDAGRDDRSAYFREQFVSALQELDVYTSEEVESVL